jgi:ribosomal protein S27AE
MEENTMDALVLKPTPVNASPLTEEILQAINGEGLWRKSNQYACRTCGHPAHIEQGGEKRFACKNCGYFSFTPTLHFEAQ